jgi:peroxiredoxin
MKFLIALFLVLGVKAHALTTGDMAPDFKLDSIDGEVQLSDLKGKVVILEWLNHGCPFVRKHYDSGNMQSLQKKYKAEGVVWLSVISSAPGKQGYVDKKEAVADKKKYKSEASNILLDPEGKVGRLYSAKTTPHMYIINKEGKLVYQGAIDDHPDTNQDSIPASKNYVKAAMDELVQGKKITAHTTKAYGCAVKY